VQACCGARPSSSRALCAFSTLPCWRACSQRDSHLPSRNFFALEQTCEDLPRRWEGMSRAGKNWATARRIYLGKLWLGYFCARVRTRRIHSAKSWRALPLGTRREMRKSRKDQRRPGALRHSRKVKVPWDVMRSTMSPGIESIPAKMPFCWVGTCGGTRGEDVGLLRWGSLLMVRQGCD
jgi:hypothetical protein